jgi:Uma2 family endonuclease
MALASRPHHFSRTEYYAIAGSLDPALGYELLDGTIYAVSPAKPPHAGVVRFLVKRLRELSSDYDLSIGDILEIAPDSAPQPDVTILRARIDSYATRHPDGSDALLVIEVSDTERNPREKMRAYMHDGRIPRAWRIDIPSRTVEVWEPAMPDEPAAILGNDAALRFENVVFTATELFGILPPSTTSPD